MKNGQLQLELGMPQCLLPSPVSAEPTGRGFLDNLQFNDNAFTFLGSTERFLRDTLSIAGRFRAGSHRVSSR